MSRTAVPQASHLQTRNGALKGRTALVTGGARGIGLAIAENLAEAGAAIAVLDLCRDLETVPYPLSRTPDLKRTIGALENKGVPALGILCDVRNEKGVARAVEKIARRFGLIDILVNNAGVSSLFPIQDLSERAWDEVVDVSLKGTFFCCKHVVPGMIAQRHGKIVNIASIAGLRGLGLSVHYAAAKHGVIGLTRALAMEVAEHGINVNAICPGTVESVALSGLASQIGLPGDPYGHFAGEHLMKHERVMPSDIAHAVRWLVGDESRFVTGAVLNVDAGWSAGA